MALEPAERAEIEALAAGRSHGGVAALVGARRYLTIDELLERSGREALVVMLDGVEDPFNFGQAVRTLYAAGVDGLVVRARNWESAAGVVARASAGASELMPTAMAPTAESAAAAARGAGLRVAAAAARSGATPLTEADLRGGLFLLVGGERRGVTRSFLAACDLVVSIPSGRADAPELGVAAAAAVLAYEALRQRTQR